VPLAKLTRPKIHQVLPRERLFARLDGAQRPVVWVVGPPGAGKTALVASWLQAHKVGGIWYQVDPGDRDLATFFHYLTQAAPGGARKKVAALPAFTTEHAADPEGFARLYFRTMFERFKPPAAIVFDNYHELPAGAPLHALFEGIAREVPERTLLIFTSRGEPPPECAALRAMDRIAIVDWDELRLTFDETCGIAALRQHLDEPTLRAVHAMADGWPVGLVLTLEQVKRGPTDPAVAGAQGREVLFAYFAGQILAALPEPVQQQLMRIALLPRATAEQAAMIAGDPNAGHLLDSLYRKRLFVERRGEAYQFHDLFRAFLVERLEATMDPDALVALRREAFAMLAAADQIEAAFDCAAAARDWQSAAQLAMRFAPRLLEQGRVATLKAWFDVLPVQVQEASPWMILWRGVSLSPFVPLQARACFEKAYEGFGDTDPIGRILSVAAILATHYLEFDHGQVDHWIDLLLPELEAHPEFPAAAAEVRVNAALLFGLSFKRPNTDVIDPCLARLRVLLSSADVPVNPKVDAAALMLAHYQVAGDFDEAERIVAMAAPWVADPELTPNYRAMWLLQLAHLRGKQGRDAEALRIYDEGQKVASDNALSLPALRIFVHLGRSIVYLCANDPERAEAERVLAAAQWTFARKLDRALDNAVRTWIAILRGQHEEARALAHKTLIEMDAHGPVWLQFGTRLLVAITEFEADPEHADIGPPLAQARTLIAGTCLDRYESAVRIVEAWVKLRREGPEAARALIERSVAGRDPYHGQFALRMHPTLLSEVYGTALQLRIAEGEVRRAIRDYGLRAPDPDARGWPWPFEVRTLGRFEVLHDGQPLAFSRKVPRKTLALLKAIIALGGRSVSEQRLLDALWPDEEGDAGARALDATVLRLRMLLGDAAAIEQRGGRISLAPDKVWVDVFAFDQALAAADAAAHRHDPAEAQPLQRALELYRGAFLAEDEGEAWPVAARERLRGRFIHALARQAETFERTGDLDAAIAAYLRGIDADPAIESFYQGLMRCYDRLGRRSEAIAAYQRMRQILSITLGLQPSAASERLFQTVRQ
jgi:DNA-binding SARP family transcriptional activator